jgi:uncharacterized membrane protein (DUF106 family)
MQSGDFFEKVTNWMGSPLSIFIHTVLFIAVFFIGILGFAPWDMVLLVLTTIVSLEAIYLALFIQMTVNRNTMSLRSVEIDVDEIQEDIKEISEEVEEIGEDVEEIQEDVEGLQKPLP